MTPGQILVMGGSTPDTIRAASVWPVRLPFRRDETATSPARVLQPDYERSAALPTGQIVPIECMPEVPGEHGSTCQTGMFRGPIFEETV